MPSSVMEFGVDPRITEDRPLKHSRIGLKKRRASSGHRTHRCRVTSRRSVRRPVIAVARDDAFCFYYPENLELLMEAGAAIEFFSPLQGEQPSPNAAGVYLGGGYPELHASELASNVGLWHALKDLRARDAPIYAECGGFMVLTQGLIDGEGRRWPMAGLIPGVARMTDKLAALGYPVPRCRAAHPNLLTEGGDGVARARISLQHLGLR